MTSRLAPVANQDNVCTQGASIEQRLLEMHGPLIGGAALHRALGFSTSDGFRQALKRDKVPIRVFGLEHRRGKFALTQDLAAWLHATRDRTV